MSIMHDEVIYTLHTTDYTVLAYTWCWPRSNMYRTLVHKTMPMTIENDLHNNNNNNNTSN